ncbi:hypothetical protein EDD27_5679 [Nonomuraea polychroma]|uniref:Uncharacterized protein n=2 Tax=Nonomuraea polychroma TaxID=46176 RepID=A0A438MBB8_9ACTN|nr:hypothetical protein EDD27_5679 [Nonomuraea polychroma]
MLLARGLYLMAAVLVAPHQADRYRAELRALLLRGQLRLHWRDENDKRRAQLIEAVTALRPLGVIVAGTGLDSRRQERARRKCMECLLWELGNHHVDDVVFERRHSELDQRDHEMVVILKGRHAIPPRLRLSWHHPEAEPLLWLPDIVAGAKSLAERGDERFWSQVNADLLVLNIDAR